MPSASHADDAAAPNAAPPRVRLVPGSLVGALISLALHLAILLTAAAIFIAAPSPPGVGDDEGVQLAVMTESELTTITEESAPSPVTNADLAASPTPVDSPIPTTAFELGLESLELSGTPMTGAGDANGAGLELAGGAGGAASFFGVEARGLRFIYIVDISGSMGGPKMAALQLELARSIRELSERASFTVFFFASETRPLGGAPRWHEARDRGKRAAENEIRAMLPHGGTNPLPAFEAAFRMKPRPDAIFFMTDGLFDNDVVPAIARFNEVGRPVPIHCISFVSRESESLMNRIAEQSGGTYTHVAGPRATP